MSGGRLKRRWHPVLVVGGTCALIGIGSILAITVPAVRAWQVGAPIAGNVPLSYVLVVDAALIVALAGLIWHLIALTLTVVDDEGITAPRLVGPPVQIRWSEVVEVSGGPRSCRIRSATQRIRLSSLHVGGEDLEPTILRFLRPEVFRRSSSHG